jgi:hypothetical protein
MSDAPHIWTRRPKIIESREIIVRPQFAGYWKIEAVKPDGRKRLLADWFPNIITDVGLDLIGTSSGWFDRCQVGTGNSTPAAGNTALDTLLATSSNRTDRTGSSNNTADRYCEATVVYRFSAGSATGNVSEIGMLLNSGSVLFSRALILDGGGSPTTITVLSDEALDCTYQVRMYPPLTDATGSFLINTDSYDFVLRAAEVDQWDLLGGGLSASVGFMGGYVNTTSNANLYPSTSTLGTVTGSPTGTSAGHTNGANQSYSPGSLIRDFSYTWGMSVAPSGGAAACRFNCGQQPGASSVEPSQLFQLSFDPVIPKDGTNTLVLNFRHAWARRTI